MSSRFHLFSLLLALIWSESTAQTGNYFLSHYSPSDKRIDFRSHDMVQDSHGEIYFASKGGVIEFDGYNWSVLVVPGAVYTLMASGSEVLIGGLTGAGKLSEKVISPRSYEMFSQTSGIFSSTYHDNKAYFCSENQLIVYSLDSLKKDSITMVNSPVGNLQGVFGLGNEVVVTTQHDGLLKVQGNALVPYSFKINNLLFSIPSPSGEAFLIGTKDNRIFILRGGELKEVELDQSDFLSHHMLADGVWVSEEVLALGTLRGGVIFVEVSSGSTEAIVDYSSGLPDNEVFSMMKDQNGGVWVAHEYGFTRIATRLPFRSFHHYPGLKGNLLCVRPFQDNIYVGTTLGLFVLTQKDQDQKERNRKGEKKTTYRSYEYQQIPSVEGKVNQLTEIDGTLYSYGVGGVYEVSGQNARLIISEPVRNVYLSPSINQVLVSTVNHQVRSFIPARAGWRETHLFDTLKNHFSYAFEDKLENIWLCGSTMVYKVEVEDNQVIEVIGYPIQNPTEDEVLGLALGTEVYVVSSGQFRHFDGSGFVKYDSLSGGHRYFASAGNFWFNDGTRWRTVDKKLQSLKTEWLGIFPGLRFLSPDSKSENLWVITDRNELYRFDNTKIASTESPYPLILREVHGREVNLAAKVEIIQSEGTFTFRFIRPNYVGTHATQYRYLVKGLDNEWSPWSSSNNIIPFSFLPAGTYQLAVQSRSAMGAESDIEQIAFQVLPPYWQRWWFYALEFVIFSFLVSLSIRLARGNARYRYVSQILTLLTVIMLIQFIQTTINSLISIQSSPVIDFFIQVCIALLVFPVEIVARNSMQKIVQNKYSIQGLFNNPAD